MIVEPPALLASVYPSGRIHINMSDSAIQGQWSLNEAGQVGWNTLRGFMTAATSDNVQVLALMACERRDDQQG